MKTKKGDLVVPGTAVKNGPPPKRNPGLFAHGEVHFIVDPEKVRALMIKHGVTTYEDLKTKEDQLGETLQKKKL